MQSILTPEKYALRVPSKPYVRSCPECASGDLDFATDGDGRWDISWHFVPCESGDDLTYIFEGSNPFYWKLQPRGGKVSVGSFPERKKNKK